MAKTEASMAVHLGGPKAGCRVAEPVVNVVAAEMVECVAAKLVGDSAVHMVAGAAAIGAAFQVGLATVQKVDLEVKERKAGWLVECSAARTVEVRAEELGVGRAEAAWEVQQVGSMGAVAMAAWMEVAAEVERDLVAKVAMGGKS